MPMQVQGLFIEKLEWIDQQMLLGDVFESFLTYGLIHSASIHSSLLSVKLSRAQEAPR
jgi:hypothetical protein